MSSSHCDDGAQPTCPPEGVSLRVMKASDLPHVRALHRNLLPVSYPAAFFVQLLINPRQLCLVAIDHGAVIGFASAAMAPNAAGGHIGEALGDTHADRVCSEPRSGIPQLRITLLTLGVLPVYQRSGIGRSLVHGVVQRLEASCVAVALPMSSDEGSKIAEVLVQVEVAKSNSAGRCFYTRLGMIDQWDSDETRFRLGPGSRTSVMVGVLCV